MRFDHAAVPSTDIPASVAWYQTRLGAEVLYEDSTWAFLNVGGTKVALVTPTQHPPHIAVQVTLEQLEKAARETNTPIDTHRDGTKGIYVQDPFGNAVELIHYPPGGTIYETPKSL